MLSKDLWLATWRRNKYAEPWPLLRYFHHETRSLDPDADAHGPP